MSSRTRRLLFASITCGICSCAPPPQGHVERYTDAIAVNIDCDEYPKGLYTLDVHVTGPVNERDRFELLCD